MVLTVLLLSLFALLVGFLVWRRVPRRHAFQILHASAWIYAASFFFGLQVVDRVAPRLLDGFVPYIPPAIVVAIFVAFALHRVRTIQR